MAHRARWPKIDITIHDFKRLFCENPKVGKTGASIIRECPKLKRWGSAITNFTPKVEFPGKSFGPRGNFGHMLKLPMMITNCDPIIGVSLCIWYFKTEHGFSLKFIGAIFAC